MIINSGDRLRLVERAGTEIREHQRSVPEREFYLRKITDTWRRAEGTEAYSELPEYSFETFEKLDVTSKNQLKKAPFSFLTAPMEDAAKYYETTGTTGLPTPTPRLAEDVIWNTVSVAEAWRDLLPEKERVLIMLPSDIVPVADLVVGVCEYLGRPHARAYPFATGISDWDRLIELCRSFRPNTVFIAPGVALQFSRLIRQRGLAPELSAGVQRMMLLGEVSTAPFRARLGRWWDASVLDASYGSTETGTLAAACARDRLHLLTATNYFELAGEDGTIRPLPESGSGRLVVTPLNLHARCVLRLDTGDDVRLGTRCDCGDGAPVIEVSGRGSDAVAVRGAKLTVRAVEEVVFGETEATGYLLETDAPGTFARLILERDVCWDRAGEALMADRLQHSSREVLGLEWDEVLFVNQLPASTKSGASQKSWKRSNFRLVGADG
ncbi:phenylacetate--CoA ligase family protein [Amycolatopsis sp. PS_44_ISF1]|uniref:phenylacetate--CoA ligase family protein n=1 Tax=Amycolatopsis sp. PS_44_ISF1 TaxID=2974917 RepID=UPI0028DDD505|nr:phenylacetate--CoA ligase family protein [Amycolatopsis sp. PS_44_ISF1]MDT8915992.1 phenylacetate--CoA ligase family protein [Amycolatopsis sp. PS_44_ISF1]